jgi:phosphoserine phosphatase SerB
MSSKFRIEVSIDDQVLELFEGGQLVRKFPVSTAAKGVGCGIGSHRTPTGRLVISEKIGDGEPACTVFRGRVAVGLWDGEQGGDEDLILTRILRLDGLDPENANSRERCIYIHGTNRADLIGTPSSHGCIRLANEEMMELFELVDEGTEVWVRPPVVRRTKLLFLDCDSTLSHIEGIDELARGMGEAVFSRVTELTEAAMNGEVPIAEVFPKRMEIIRPNRETAERVADLYVRTMVPHALEMVRVFREDGWVPVILSGGFAPLIEPLARALSIDHVEAVPLHFTEDGSYDGYGASYPTTRNMGKNEVIREWKAAMSPQRVVMIGDGVSDLETRPDVDLFIGYGGVVERASVRRGADQWITSMEELIAIRHTLAGHDSVA